MKYLVTFCYDDRYTEEWIDKIKDFIANKNYLHPVIVNIITLAG